jgi:hypothetical protein
MPQDEPEKRQRTDPGTNPISKKHGLMGDISRMLLASLYPSPFAPIEAQESRDQALSPALPTDIRKGRSFTNHGFTHTRHRTDLARLGGRAAPPQSLQNMPAHRPVREQWLTGISPANSRIHNFAAIKEIVRFYLVFLSAVAKRQDDVRGALLQNEIGAALESATGALSRDEQLLLPDASCWQQPESFLTSIDKGMKTGQIRAPGPGRIRDIYVRALKELLTRLEGRIDDSLVRLLFRLAARDALREDGNIAMKYSLLKGIPDVFLKQPGSSSVIDEMKAYAKGA